MLPAIRKRITYANVAMTLALVFAMSGGAYAAHKYLITSTKQINPKVLQALKGKSGPAGKDGTNGVNGANGAPGPAGEKGANGTNGTNGESVLSKEVKPGELPCSKLGGTSFTAGGKTDYACNGKEGSPWTAGGTLPTHKTETGVWAYVGDKEEGKHAEVPISFMIPLGTKVLGEFIENAETGKTAHCKGYVAEMPTAEPGYLCVYAKSFNGVELNEASEPFFNPGEGTTPVSLTGTLLTLKVNLTKAIAGFAIGAGTWAVTAE